MPLTTEHAGVTLADLLIAHGVDTVFGLAGAQHAALYDGIALRQGEIQHVSVRDERTGAYAADAYARISGRVGVCDATVGPGTTKLQSGLGEALNSSIPVLALVSELPLATESRRYRGAESQALDQEGLLRPVTKWVATVRRVEHLAPYVRRAFREATTGRPGPVALILPQDLLDGPPAEAVGDPFAARFGRFPSTRPIAEPEDVSSVVRLIRAARRPLVILGGGAVLSGAHSEALQVAEATGMGVATTPSGKGCFDESHPLSVGVLSQLMGTESARSAAEEADLLLLIGTKFGDSTTLGWKLPLPGQQIAQVDVDPIELGRDVPADAFMLADARVGLKQILDELDATTESLSDQGWREHLIDLVSSCKSARQTESGSSERPIAPQRVMAELAKLIRRDDIIVADASLSSGWVGCCIDVSSTGPRTLLPRGLAGLGWALPAAIGAAEASPGSRIVAVMGDGAIAYAVGELATIVERDMPITVIVLNNSSLGMMRWYRRIHFGRGWEDPDAPLTDFAAVAAAYGIRSDHVEDPDAVGSAIAAALESGGPALIDVNVPVWETPVIVHRTALTDNVSALSGSAKLGY